MKLNWTADSERREFLRALDEADVEVTEWEARFIESSITRHTGAILFSDKQRAVIDRLFFRYACGDEPAVRFALKSRVQSPESGVQAP